jgi:hypothetical protein
MLMFYIPAIIVMAFIYPKYAHGMNEYEYQKPWCDKRGGEIENPLPDLIRPDCVFGDFAVEVDFAYKYAEGISQGLLYGKRLGKIPVLLLIVRTGKDCKYVKRAYEIITFSGIGIVIWETGDYAYRCF